jgi:8-oxo-dGTP diphosphatase
MDSTFKARVTAALIPAQGRLFIAQRPPQKKFGLLWEFPGGKVESGESLQESLIREIREELCWEVQVGKLFQRIQCRLLDLNIDLYAFWCAMVRGRLCLKEHVAYHWAKVSELHRFGFTEVDRQLVLMIQELSELPRMSRPTDLPDESCQPF